MGGGSGGGAAVHIEGLERAWQCCLGCVMSYELVQLHGLAQVWACAAAAGSTSTMPRHQQPTDV
jgi:hypothetical protein